MVLPLTVNDGNYSLANHAAWHDEMADLVPFLGLPTTYSHTDPGTLGHLKHHGALEAFVNPDATDTSFAEFDLGHYALHERAHAYLTNTTVTNLTTASDVGAALTAGATGAVFGLAAGTYRPTATLAPKQDQRIYGAHGAILSGGRVVTGWTAAGSDWWATRATGTLGSQLDQDRCAVTGCENPNDLYVVDAGVIYPLVRVGSLGAMAAGTFFEDFGAGRVYVRLGGSVPGSTDPNDHNMEQAVLRRLIQSSASGVRVENFIAQLSANQAQQATIEADGNNWLIDHGEIRYGHSVAVRQDGNSTAAKHLYVHHMGQMGMGGDGDDILVEDTEIAYCNRDAHYSAIWEAGGSKWANCARPRIRRVWSHHNKGVGLWCDINVGNAIYEYCRVNDNAGSNFDRGVYYELSYGEVTLGDGLWTEIRYCVVLDNAPNATNGLYGGGQIVASASRRVRMYGNIIRGRDGIGGQAQLRVDSPDGRGAHEVWDLQVYDNDCETTGGGFSNLAGIQSDDASQVSGGIYSSRGNRFGLDGPGNRYYVPSTGSFWTWDDDFETWANWQAAGHDPTGTRTVGGHITDPGPPVLETGPRGSLA